MKSLALILTPLALALSVPDAAMAHDSAPPAIAPGSTLLTLSAEGKRTGTPDLAVFSAGVTTDGKTAGAAMTANSAAMARVIAALKKAGVADRDIQTASINLNPIYSQPVPRPGGQGDGEPRVVGYQAVNMVTVRARDIENFGAVLDALVASGANQIAGPSFQMSDPAAALDEARISAMKAARSRADLYARGAGLRVVRIISINEGGGYAPPPPVYAMARMMASDSAPVPVQSGELETQVTVTVQFELAP